MKAWVGRQRTACGSMVWATREQHTTIHCTGRLRLQACRFPSKVSLRQPWPQLIRIECDPGTRARLIGTTDIKNTSGTIDPTWDCIIDQKSVGPTEPFPYTQNNWALCEWSNLSDATHTVTVKVSSSGQSFWADRIVYIPSDDVELKGATIMVSRLDPAVSFDTKWKLLGDIGTMTQTSGASVRIKFKGKVPSSHGKKYSSLMALQAPELPGKGRFLKSYPLPQQAQPTLLTTNLKFGSPSQV